MVHAVAPGVVHWPQYTAWTGKRLRCVAKTHSEPLVDGDKGGDGDDDDYFWCYCSPRRKKNLSQSW